MMIDVSKAYDNQGPLKNGLYDSIVLPKEPCLYRSGRLNRFLWSVGRKLGNLPFVKKLVKVK